MNPSLTPTIVELSFMSPEVRGLALIADLKCGEHADTNITRQDKLAPVNDNGYADAQLNSLVRAYN